MEKKEVDMEKIELVEAGIADLFSKFTMGKLSYHQMIDKCISLMVANNVSAEEDQLIGDRCLPKFVGGSNV